jgi:hypothetical protein
MKSANHTDDRGSILPIVLVIVLVLAVVVVATAKYATGTLKYGQVAEQRADLIATASAAMDDAIEQIGLRGDFAICATGVGGSGISKDFPEVINDATARVTCRLAPGSLPTTEGFALIVTGEGVTSPGPSLQFSLGGRPEIGGPVFVHDATFIDLQQPSTIVQGDLWYTDNTCAGDPAGTNPEAVFERSSVIVPQLSFDPPTRGINCINRTWFDIAGTGPTIPTAALTALPTDPPTALITTPDGDCTVFVEGRYTSLPLTDNNYFESGLYLFDDIGYVGMNKQRITIGNSDQLGFPAITNSACDSIRTADSVDGATVYVQGDAQFDIIGNDTSFEIAGRGQAGTPSLVALQVIDAVIDHTKPLLAAENGAKREIALNGLLFAPYRALDFETIPAQKAAVLRGGAVVAKLLGSVSAAGSGFVIETPASGAQTKLVLDSTATQDGTSTTIRVVTDIRPATGAVAMNSWRVCDRTGC